MSTQQSAAVAMHIHNDSAGVRPMPPIIDKQVFTVPNFSSMPLFTSEIPDIPLNTSMLKADQWVASSGINRRFTVHGVKDSLAKTDELIGRVALPNKVTYQVIAGAARPQKCFTLAPAIAAMASDLKDRSYVAALTAAQTLFNTRGSTERFSAATQSAVRTLLNSPPDPTRFVFKLAQLWVYHVYCESCKVHPALVGTIGRAVELTEVSAVASALVAGKQGIHYAFVPGDQYAGCFDNILSVLAVAAANMTVPASQRGALPSILSVKIDMPPITVAYTGYSDGPLGITNDLSSADVWEAMSMWASFHECIPLMQEMVDFVVGQLYSTKAGCDEIFSVEQLTLSLPPLDMAHYALFPLHMAVTDLPQMQIPEPPHLLTHAAPLVLRNQLLSVCLSAALARLHIGAKQNNYKRLHQANRWLALVFSPRSGHVSNAWSVLQSAAVDLGLKVGFSRTTASLMPAGWRNSNLNECWRAPMMRATQFEELVDVLPTVPTCSIAHMMAPVKSDLLCQPGHMYSIDSIAGGWLSRAAYAISQVGGSIFNLARNRGSFSVDVQPAEFLLSYRHILHDNAIPYKYADEDAEQKTVFSVPDVTAAVALYQGDKARAGWSWFISGVNADSLKTDEIFRLSDSSSLNDTVSTGQIDILIPSTVNTASAPESGRKAMTAPEPDDLPPPTDAERLKNIALRVPTQVRVLTDSINTTISPGVFRDLANTLLKCADPEKPVGITDLEWRRGFLNNLRERVAGVSIADALRPVNLKSRHRVAAGMSKMFKQLVQYTDYEDNRRVLSELAVRADNIAYAMAINPALTGAELKESMDVPGDFLDTLDGISTVAVEYGLDLSSFVDKQKTRLKYRVVADGSAEYKELKRNGWAPSSDQGKVATGKISLCRKEIVKRAGQSIESIFAPELLEKITAKAANVLAELESIDNTAASDHQPIPVAASAIEVGMISDENDATIGRVDSGNITELRNAAASVRSAVAAEQSFQESQIQSGSGQSLPIMPATGTEQSSAAVKGGKMTASVVPTSSEPTSIATLTGSWDTIPAASFTEVPDKR